MKFKFGDFKKTMYQLQYTLHMEETDFLEISFREEDIQSGRVASCITIVTTQIKEPKDYDRIKTQKVTTTTIEIFPDTENRPVRVTTQESQELD